MKFKKLSLISIISSVLSLVIAILLAYQGFGVYALIAQTLSFLLCRVICLFLECGFLKSLAFSWRSFKELFNFGGWLFLANLVQSACNNVYANIIPKIGTYTENGYYTQSAKISGVPANTIALTVGSVFFPYLSKMKTEEDLVREARIIHRKIYHLSFPFLFLLPIFSDVIILIVLGNNWVGAGFYLRILLFAGVFDLYVAFMRNILKSAGRTKAISNLEIIKSIIRIVSIIVSVFIGMKMLIYSILFTSVVNAIISSLFVRNNICYNLKNQLSDLVVPVSFSLGTMLGIFFVYRLLFYQNIWSVFLIIVGYVLYFVILISIKNKEVMDMRIIAVEKIRAICKKK